MYHNKNLTIKISKKLFVWALVLIATGAIAIGDVEREPAETGEEVSAVESGIIPLFECAEGFDIRKALAMLGRISQKNIVPSSSVDGELAFRRLTNITFEDAMNAILGINFKYEEKGNLINVYTNAEYEKMKQNPTRMIYKVFTLYYISAAEVMKLVLPILSIDGKIEATSPAETGVPTGETISQQTGGGDNTAMNDTIIIYDFPENIAKAEEIIGVLDIRPKQVLIEAAILSATLTEDMQFGIDWNTLKGDPVTGLGDISQGDPDFYKAAGTSAVVEGALTGGLTVGLTIDDIGAFIRAVEEVTNVTLMANPKILTVNKQLGQVYIGNKLGYREGNIETAGGGEQEGSVKFLDTGIKLSFRPYIGDDGYIRMDIHPKDSSGSVPGGIPQETATEIVTNIIVKDGQTIVIGGLFRDKITNVKTQVPLLGDIPILGVLFRGTADQVERQEVIVLLTPHIITDPDQTGAEQRADDIRRKRFGANDQLQWIGRGRLAEDSYTRAVNYYVDGDAEAALDELESALRLRPAFLEALRLKERIISETDPEKAAKMERIIRTDIETKESEKWMRW